jgi:hypothetical protein
MTADQLLLEQEQTTNQSFERSTTMNHLMSEELARAHVSARLEQAQKQRLAHNLAAARRLSRKAERAAAQARLALARVI